MRFHLLRLLFFTLLLSFIPGRLLPALEVPYLASRVNDYAGILSPEAIQRLEETLKAHEDSTSNQIVVLTITSLAGEVIEEYSMKVVEAWKLGTAQNDNGVLLLIAKEDRELRIEVGNGLEGVLPDGLCGTIIRQEIVPHFKDQRYDDGVEAGISAILRAIANEYQAESEFSDFDQDVPPWPLALGVFAFFLFVVGTFTVSAVFTTGFMSWFMYVFLIPFWLMFPMGLFGVTIGFAIFAVYIVGFIVAKIFFATNPSGKKFSKQWGTKFASSGRSSSGGSSRSSFSGGGGSFSGGGSSGRW